VPGGQGNTASGADSFAAGYEANATNDGSFVWSDFQLVSPFYSTNNNSFNVRAQGGARFVTSGAGMSIDGQSVLTTGSSIAASQLPDGLGGSGNQIADADGATIAGGNQNAITNAAVYGTVSGGYGNVIDGGLDSVIGGGYQNFINASFATIPGGSGNSVTGDYSFAAGQQAQAVNQGCFVWADSQNAPFTSTTNDQFLIRAQGGVGIGTTTPTKGALEVDSVSGQVPAYDPAGFLETSGAAGNLSFVAHGNVSIWAAGLIYGDAIFAFSDERIKNIIGQSDGAADLKTLLGIQITDYTFKDTIAKGNRPQKKVIAQQVEKVFPQAVSRSTDEVPDIYKPADIKDGWIQLVTDLKVGERVKLIGDKEQGVYAVLEVRDGAFRTSFKPAAEKVFVYGREVKDFRSVDYEAIAMLNVSATQELARKLEAESSEVAELKQELAELKQTMRQLAEAVNGAKLATLPKAPAHTGGGVSGTLATASLQH
jgi:hypothetical protein